MILEGFLLVFISQRSELLRVLDLFLCYYYQRKSWLNSKKLENDVLEVCSIKFLRYLNNDFREFCQFSEVAISKILRKTDLMA